MTSSIQGFSNLSINLDKSKTDLENAKGTNKVCAVKTRQQVSAENIWTPWNGGYSTPELQKLQRNDTDIGPIFLWKENVNILNCQCCAQSQSWGLSNVT
jgi:hypothetical protein